MYWFDIVNWFFHYGSGLSDNDRFAIMHIDKKKIKHYNIKSVEAYNIIRIVESVEPVFFSWREFLIKFIENNFQDSADNISFIELVEDSKVRKIERIWEASDIKKSLPVPYINLSKYTEDETEWK